MIPVERVAFGRDSSYFMYRDKANYPSGVDWDNSGMFEDLTSQVSEVDENESNTELHINRQDSNAGVKWTTWNNEQWIAYDDDDDTFMQKKAIDQKNQSSANNLVSSVSDGETKLVADTSSYSGLEDQTCNSGLESDCCSDFKAPPTKWDPLLKAGDAVKDATEATAEPLTLDIAANAFSRVAVPALLAPLELVEYLIPFVAADVAVLLLGTMCQRDTHRPYGEQTQKKQVQRRVRRDVLQEQRPET
ncbi:hypothetical protein F5X98DRAFT_381715 [Xylaria grammica]|nr:hypothetical protein F5X98DRAFT_381715 [Xylaria grammica]